LQLQVPAPRDKKVFWMNKQLALGSDSIPVKLFNDQGEYYDDVVKRATFHFDKIWKETLLRKLPDIDGKKILDIGCGTGLLSIRLAENGAQVYGIDVAEGMLIHAEQRFWQRGMAGEFRVASANEIPYGNNMFDAVVSCYVPKYCDVEKHIEEVKRILKPGGFIAEYDFSAPHITINPLSWGHAVYYYNMKQIAKVIEPFDKNKNYVRFFEVLQEIIERSNWEERMLASLELNGFHSISTDELTAGMATLITAKK
jgi:ubiquinone/menaquinone biosynthesis C-methylase UbiE